MYGEEFMPASIILKVITWYTSFAYLGVARNAWIVCENRQKYLKYIYLFAAILNVGLNFAFIPFLKGVGASLASVITQLFTCIVLPLLIKGLRRNVILMFKGIVLPFSFLKDHFIKGKEM